MEKERSNNIKIPFVSDGKEPMFYIDVRFGPERARVILSLNDNFCYDTMEFSPEMVVPSLSKAANHIEFYLNGERGKKHEANAIRGLVVAEHLCRIDWSQLHKRDFGSITDAVFEKAIKESEREDFSLWELISRLGKLVDRNYQPGFSLYRE